MSASKRRRVASSSAPKVRDRSISNQKAPESVKSALEIRDSAVLAGLRRFFMSVPELRSHSIGPVEKQ
jgi:hypothetical protein